MNLSQVIVFTQRPEFKMLLELEGKDFSGFNPLFYKDEDELKSMLSLLDSVDLFIIDGPEDKLMFFSIIKELEHKAKNIKQIFILTNEELPFEYARFFLKEDVQLLMNNIRALFNSTSSSIEGFISMPIDSLLHFKILPFDLFVKVGSDNYVKRIPAHEEIDASTFAAFTLRGVNELYFEKKFNKDFSVMLINSMINKVEKEYETLDEKLLATNEVYQTTHQIVSKLGFKPRVIEVCESVLNQISEDVMSSKDNFAVFLDKLRTQSELSFNYRLMELTSFVATQIIEELPNLEESDKFDKIRNIVFASMFCDATLTNNGQVHLRKPDQILKLSSSEQKQINEHALKASELVLQYKNAPLDAATLIREHHGSLTGMGLAKVISPKILPLSKCLMVAQEISYLILMESYRPPIDVLRDINIVFVGTPLYEYFTLFDKSCRNNMNESKV